MQLFIAASREKQCKVEVDRAHAELAQRVHDRLDENAAAHAAIFPIMLANIKA